jgi:hypothetical protein
MKYVIKFCYGKIKYDIQLKYIIFLFSDNKAEAGKVLRMLAAFSR